MNLRNMLKSLRRLVQIMRVSILDMVRYTNYSSVFFKKDNAEALESKLTILAHAVEKGLALPEPKPGYGQARIVEMMHYHTQLEKAGPGSSALSFSLGVLKEYFSKGHAEHLPDEVALRLRSFVNQRNEADRLGGVLQCSSERVKSTIPEGITNFFTSRHSVRDFADTPVEREEIKEAVRLAQSSPSVCNRQPWKVYVAEDEKTRAAVLSFQNGNRGFGERARTVLIVTVPLHAFHGPLERNEAYVDGGMFSMSLIWALHALGIGSCALNWCATPARDKGLRNAVGIPDSEVVIMQIAVGHLKDSYLVARSPRKPTSSLIHFLD